MSARILVTGATGLVGNNVVRQLLRRGDAVRAFTRATSRSRPLEDLDVEPVVGELSDEPSLRQAVAGCRAVIHAAAFVHVGWSQLETHRKVNVEGTRRVAKACRAEGIRMVHVSSVDTLGLGPMDAPADEDSPPFDDVPCPYVVTKREAEAAVQAEIAAGLDATLVNPTFMLGPWDWRPSSGKLLLEVGRRFVPVAPAGGNNFSDVRDVAAGILAALDHGAPGRRYILGGHNLTYWDAFHRFSSVGGSSPPWATLGPVNRWFIGLGGDLWGRITGTEPDVNSAALALGSLDHYFTSARAERELNYRMRPLEETLVDAWEWFAEHGYLE